MSQYEKHENYKFKALRGKIEKSARVKGSIILTFITNFEIKRNSEDVL